MSMILEQTQQQKNKPVIYIIPYIISYYHEPTITRSQSMEWSVA